MSSNSMTRYPVAPVLAMSLALAIALIASPLMAAIALVTPFCLARCARGLPDDERRFLIGVLAVALFLRCLLIAAQLLKGLPLLNDMSIGALAGDESYYLSRALRVRDLLLGHAATKYDYFVATDSYGQTSYLSLLTWLQVIAGPTPYSMKVANALIYVCGCGLLFRMARTAFGVLPAFGGVGLILFLPSLMFSSVSLLKESAYFFVAAAFVSSSWHAVMRVREDRWSAAVPAMAVAAISLTALDGLRRGGLVLMAGGVVAGLAIGWIGQSRRRVAGAGVAFVLALVMIAAMPNLHTRFVTGVESAAKIHAGNVFTVGHVYKLLDEGFYVMPAAPLAWDLQLSDAQALRFLVRAASSFVVTPWPWEMRSTSELAFLPEHVIWYLLLVAFPFGIVAGWRIDPLATALLLGFTLSAAVVVALTNGNVGTLLRMRGLVTPYLVWISAIGVCTVGERLAAARTLSLTERPAL
jgi:hypothetical protein